MWSKTMYYDVFEYHAVYVYGSSHFWTLFFSNLSKTAHFWLNWKCSEGVFTMCPTLPQNILWNLRRKIPTEKNIPWHRCCPVLPRGSNCQFCQKNAFFGQKMSFFWKVHFIQNLSVTQNTVFQWVKNHFLLSNPKLVFFTRFYLNIPAERY